MTVLYMHIILHAMHTERNGKICNHAKILYIFSVKWLINAQKLPLFVNIHKSSGETCCFFVQETQRKTGK